MRMGKFWILACLLLVANSLPVFADGEVGVDQDSTDSSTGDVAPDYTPMDYDYDYNEIDSISNSNTNNNDTSNNDTTTNDSPTPDNTPSDPDFSGFDGPQDSGREQHYFFLTGNGVSPVTCNKQREILSGSISNLNKRLMSGVRLGTLTRFEKDFLSEKKNDLRERLDKTKATDCQEIAEIDQDFNLLSVQTYNARRDDGGLALVSRDDNKVKISKKVDDLVNEVNACDYEYDQAGKGLGKYAKRNIEELKKEAKKSTSGDDESLRPLNKKMAVLMTLLAQRCDKKTLAKLKSKKNRGNGSSSGDHGHQNELNHTNIP